MASCVVAGLGDSSETSVAALVAYGGPCGPSMYARRVVQVTPAENLVVDLSDALFGGPSPAPTALNLAADMASSLLEDTRRLHAQLAHHTHLLPRPHEGVELYFDPRRLLLAPTSGRPDVAALPSRRLPCVPETATGIISSPSVCAGLRR